MHYARHRKTLRSRRSGLLSTVRTAWYARTVYDFKNYYKDVYLATLTAHSPSYSVLLLSVTASATC